MKRCSYCLNRIFCPCLAKNKYGNLYHKNCLLEYEHKHLKKELKQSINWNTK